MCLLPTLTFTVPLPLSVNRIWRVRAGGGVYLTAKALAYKQEVTLLTRQALRLSGWTAEGMQVIASDWIVRFKIVAKTRRYPDPDNLSKLLLDGLKGALFDDQHLFPRPLYPVTVSRRFPRLEVCLHPALAEEPLGPPESVPLSPAK